MGIEIPECDGNCRQSIGNWSLIHVDINLNRLKKSVAHCFDCFTKYHSKIHTLYWHDRCYELCPICGKVHTELQKLYEGLNNERL